MIWGWLDTYVQNKEAELLPHTIYKKKNNLKIYQRPKLKAKTLKFSEGNLGINLYDLEFCNGS